MWIYIYMCFLDFYNFWLILIDSFSDIKILVILVGIYVENKLLEVSWNVDKL